MPRITIKTRPLHSSAIPTGVDVMILDENGNDLAKTMTIESVTVTIDHGAVRALIAVCDVALDCAADA